MKKVSSRSSRGDADRRRGSSTRADAMVTSSKVEVVSGVEGPDGRGNRQRTLPDDGSNSRRNKKSGTVLLVGPVGGILLAT